MSKALPTQGVFYDMSDEDYHKQYDRKDHFYSSSQLKDILEDKYKFKDKYLLGQEEKISQQQQDAYDVGTVVHTAILEPEKLKDSYVVWETGSRKGIVWEEFKEEHKGKLILTKTMKEKATNAIKAVKKSPLAMSCFEDGEPEVSFFVNFHGLNVKVRADWLRSPVIDDLKTTTGNVRDELKIKQKIKGLNYDLSAAFYLDVINYCIDLFELDIPKIKTFRWIFASKDSGGYCQIYDAKNYIPMGRAKYLEAIRRIKKYEAMGWEFKEEIVTLDPFGYEVADWIKPENKEEKSAEVADEDLL